MSEFASVIATTEGPLHLYAAPGINSHGEARTGWGIKGGAEVEWTDESPDYLTVRYEDEKMAKTIKAMFLQRFSTRAAMLATIVEVRGQGGQSLWYREGKLQISEDITVLGNLDLRLYPHPLPAGLTTTGDLYGLDSYPHPLPAGLTTTGDLNLTSYLHPLPAGLTTTGNLGLRGYPHPLPAGLTTTGYLNLTSYLHPLPAGLTTTGNLGLRGYPHPLPAGLTTTGSLYGLDSYQHPLPTGLTTKTRRI